MHLKKEKLIYVQLPNCSQPLLIYATKTVAVKVRIFPFIRNNSVCMDKQNTKKILSYDLLHQD